MYCIIQSKILTILSILQFITVYTSKKTHVQIILLAVILALLFKKLPEDDIYKSKIIVPCGPVELPKTNYKSRRARMLANRPPPHWVLNADRYRMLLDEKVTIFIHDLVLYSTFLTLTLVAIYLMRDSNTYHQNANFNKLALVKVSIYNTIVLVHNIFFYYCTT